MISTFRNRRIAAALSTNGGASPWWLSGGIPAANCIAAYQPKGAASLAESYTNLANPGTYNAELGTAPSWLVGTGWTFNGSSQFLRTGVIPTTGMSVIVRFSGVDTTPSRYLFGSFDATNRYAITPNYGSDPLSVRYYAGGTGNRQLAPNMTSGILAIAGTNAYRNTTLDGTIPGGTKPNYGIYIGALNSSGSAGSRITGSIQALAIYGIDITSYIAALNTAMAAL